MMTMLRRLDLASDMLCRSLDVFQNFQSGETSGCAHDSAPGMSGRTTYIKILNGRAEARIAWRGTQEEKLLQREFTLENVAFAQSPLTFEIKRSDDLPVQDDVFDVRRILGNRVDDSIAEGFLLIIPVQAGAQFVGRILHEAGEHVFARWCDRWVGERRDNHINVRMAREVAVLGIVVGALHIFD